MKSRYSKKSQEKLFGGFNFIVVLWSLLTLFSLVVSLDVVTFADFLVFDFMTLVIPILFLLVLNLFIGISLFAPKKGNQLWVLSLIVATASIITINTFQAKLAHAGDPPLEEVSKF